MKPPLALPAIVLLGLCTTACSGVSSGAGSASRSSSALPHSEPPRDSDDDDDNTGKGLYDSDDDLILHFGHAADAADRRAITALVKRYYTAAAAGDGITVCSLLYSIVAEVVPEDYGESLGSSSQPAQTCAAVVSNLFGQRHQKLAADAASLKVTLVRVSGDHGVVLLRSGTAPERRILVRREHGAWKLNELFDSGVP